MAITRTLCGVLGGHNAQPPVVLLQLLADHRGLAVQVHITPAKPGRLAASQAAQGDQVIGGIQPVHRTESRNFAVCAAVHTRRGPFPGPAPLHDPVRRPHHRPGTARPRRLRPGAGLSVIRPRRIAAFSVARSVARIRVKVAADTGEAPGGKLDLP
jgi:hypothetical protein